MVTNRIQHSGKEPVKQGAGAIAPEPNKIGASTPFDFSGKNLTQFPNTAWKSITTCVRGWYTTA